MEKYLITIEFRYHDKPTGEYDGGSRTKVITIGTYNNFEDACVNGNKTLETLESIFKLHSFPDGRKATKERFSLNGGAFRSKKDLITNLAYLKTPFEFYAKITTLKYESIEQTINEVRESVKRYRDFKK